MVAEYSSMPPINRRPPAIKGRLAAISSSSPGDDWDLPKDTPVHRILPQVTLRLIFDQIFRVYIIEKCN